MVNFKHHRLFTFGLPFFFLLLLNTANSQIKSKENTLQQAKKYIGQKNYSKAESLLAAYYPKHRKDLETTWLYAQVAHWNKHEKLSISLFENAVKIAPDDYNLKLDFARMLYENTRISYALILINEIKAKGNTPVEALLLEANILFWYGKIKDAKAIIAVINQWYPGTYLTKELEKNISSLCATHINSNVDYQTDNQPMKLFSEQVSVEKFRSELWHPLMQIDNYNFNPKNNTLEIKAQNRFLLARYGLSAGISTGIYQNFNDKLKWTGSFDLHYKAGKNNRVSIGLNRKPYLGTLKSTEISLLQNNAYAEMESESIKKFEVHIGYNYQFFDDNNSINSFGGWIVRKANQKRKFTLQYGYGLSYSTASKNVFESALPIASLVSQYTDGMSIAGIYNPYFTPQHQLVNTALLILNYKPFKKMEIGLKANYGFYAFCDNPYLFLEKNSTNEIVLGKKYAKVNFNPYDIQANVNYKINGHFDAGIKYHYQETFFYSRNLMSLSLHYTL